jgi:hypothetical protein
LKSLKTLLLSGVATAAVFAPQSGMQPAIATDMPNTGMYFIINALNDHALEPLGGTPGQNVFLSEYTKSGMQKWNLTRQIDPKTKQPTNRYTIRLAGDSTKLYLAPFPVSNHTSILDSSPSVFIVQPAGDDFVIRSVARNGDSLCCVANPPLRDEVQIQPQDESSRFHWKFVKTEF